MNTASVSVLLLIIMQRPLFAKEPDTAKSLPDISSLDLVAGKTKYRIYRWSGSKYERAGMLSLSVRTKKDITRLTDQYDLRVGDDRFALIATFSTSKQLGMMTKISYAAYTNGGLTRKAVAEIRGGTVRIRCQPQDVKSSKSWKEPVFFGTLLRIVTRLPRKANIQYSIPQITASYYIYAYGLGKGKGRIVSRVLECAGRSTIELNNKKIACTKYILHPPKNKEQPLQELYVDDKGRLLRVVVFQSTRYDLTGSDP